MLLNKYAFVVNCSVNYHRSENGRAAGGVVCVAGGQAVKNRAGERQSAVLEVFFQAPSCSELEIHDWLRV